MNKPQYLNDEAPFITVEMAKSRYNLCKEKIMQLAKESGALIRFGRTVRINVKKLDDYFIKQYTE